MSTVAIIGAGLIGRSWAHVFARAGWLVQVWDPLESQRATAAEQIARSLFELERHGLVKDAAVAASNVSVLGAGRNQLPIATQSVALGGNVRVGREDSLWIGAGKLAESNAQQVRAARQIIEGLGLQVASSDEARAML